MLSSRAVLVLAVLTLVSTACSEPRPAPELFAREVVASVAAGDFARFWALNDPKEILVHEALPVPTDGLASSISPYNELRARDEFDRVARSGRIDRANFASIEPVVVATEHQRWTLELFDAQGRGLGVQMQLRKWGQGYRLVGLHLMTPGKPRESVMVQEY